MRAPFFSVKSQIIVVSVFVFLSGLLLLGGFLHYRSLSETDRSVERDVSVLGRSFASLMEEVGPEGDYASVIGRFRSNFIGCLDIEELYVLLPGLTVQPTQPPSHLAQLIEEAAAFPSEMKKTNLINGRWVAVQRLRPRGFGHVVVLFVLSRKSRVTSDWLWVMVPVAIVLIFHIVLSVYFIHKKVFEPANELALSIESTVNGGGRIPSDKHTAAYGFPLLRVDEAFDTFTSSIKKVIEELSEAVSAMAETCSRIDSLSAQSDASVGLSEKAVEATSKTLQEIRGIVNMSLDRVKSVVSISGRTDREASQGKLEIGQILESMKTVNGSLLEIEGLSSSMEKIADFANGLALKSAIEAARDNDSSSGICQVAQEMKELASKLSEISRRISVLSSSNGALLSNSAQAGDSAAEKLESIVNGIEKTNILVSQIAEDIHLWMSLVNRVMDNITDVDSSVRENALTAQSGREAAAQLLKRTIEVNQALNDLTLRTGR